MFTNTTDEMITFEDDLGVEPGLFTFDLESVKFISDTHWWHKNIIKYSNRPFTDVPEMNEAMRDRWYESITASDIIIHCGDVGFKGTTEINAMLDSLPGYKVLVKGNHDFDRGKKKFRDLNFDFTTDKLHFTHGEKKYVVTHVPVEDDKLRGTNMTNIHGHVHNRTLETGMHICACVEITDYRPVTLTRLLELNQNWVNDPNTTHREGERRN